MGARLRFTILGCGSSPGVPRVTGDWGACDRKNPKNRRRRTAALVERVADDGRVTRVVIDTGPDFRDQMIDAGADTLDAAVYTHMHADHIHGIDDLRGYVHARRGLMDVFADAPTLERMKAAFAYLFETPAGGTYPPVVAPHVIDHDTPFTVSGSGGPLTFTPLPQIHGRMTVLGFRVGGVAYCPDVSDFPNTTVPLLEGLELLVVDALQYKPHPTHFSLGQALEWIARLEPRRAVLTHMHVPLDHDTVARETPDNVMPGHDGMALEFALADD